MGRGGRGQDGLFFYLRVGQPLSNPLCYAAIMKIKTRDGDGRMGEPSKHLFQAARSELGQLALHLKRLIRRKPPYFTHFYSFYAFLRFLYARKQSTCQVRFSTSLSSHGFDATSRRGKCKPLILSTFISFYQVLTPKKRFYGRQGRNGMRAIPNFWKNYQCFYRRDGV
jgi:hypothetical protein